MNLLKLIAKGESETLELKRSTGELRSAMQALCAFANGKGGRVVFGVDPRGELVGQTVSERTLHEIAERRIHFEPPLELEVEVAEVTADRKAIVISVRGDREAVPYTYDGRAYERVLNTTRRMPRERFDSLTLDRLHSRRRWENQEADEIRLKDLRRAEVLRIVESARQLGRLEGELGNGGPELLDRLGVRREGRILRAAVVLFGKTFLPWYPQCELRMARFRGVDKTEFLDQKDARGPAVHLLEEAQLFCRRHFPLPGRIEPGRWQRVDRPLIPPDAMREILVNALIHRDYGMYGASIHPAIFDDRVEVWSPGGLPSGVTAESLSGEHLSVRRNPIIADVFHRAGLIEKWGRGTNRVIEMCLDHGIAAPEFREVAGATVVTFRVPVAGPWFASGVEDRPAPAYPSDPLQVRILAVLVHGARSKPELATELGLRRVTTALNRALNALLADDRIALTAPDVPRSRRQKYRYVSPAELRPFRPRRAR